jgi:hypothetical protein
VAFEIRAVGTLCCKHWLLYWTVVYRTVVRDCCIRLLHRTVAPHRFDRTWPTRTRLGPVPWVFSYAGLPRAAPLISAAAGGGPCLERRGLLSARTPTGEPRAAPPPQEDSGRARRGAALSGARPAHARARERREGGTGREGGREREREGERERGREREGERDWRAQRKAVATEKARRSASTSCRVTPSAAATWACCRRSSPR